MAEALAQLKAGAGDCLVVYRLDRLAPDLILQETLVERLRGQGTPVRSASQPDIGTDSDDPTKVLIRQIVGAVAQYERAVIRGRMMAGREAKRQAGGFIGGRVPFGFKLEDRQVVADEAEQVTVQLVGRLHANRMSLREIAKELADRGITTRSGGRWHPTTISRLVPMTPKQ